MVVSCKTTAKKAFDLLITFEIMIASNKHGNDKKTN